MTSTKEALTLRAASSAALLGILEGYGHTSFDSHRGWNLLDRFSRSWLHTAAFLTGTSLKSLLEALPETEIRQGLDLTLMPLVHAFDILAAQPDDSFQLPRLSQFIWTGRRLEISLALPRHLMQARAPEVHCYLVPSQVSPLQLSESLSRDAAVIALAPPPGLFRRAQLPDALVERLLDTTPVTDRTAFNSHLTAVANRGLAILRGRATQSLSTEAPHALTHNLAELFPLHNPFLTNTYYFIHRDSVKHLIARLEADTGVRLWCSLRRSGKTTACFDLASTSANTALVSQTMDDTEQRQNASVFARKILGYLHGGQQLPPAFFRDTALECLDDYSEGQKIVFVLDEYETLFDQISLTAAERPTIRYTLGQPLLNQMVAFSRDNVLIFIGQQPDAHYILMEQNQLSPCVRQDSFPLFHHSRGFFQSEFTALLRKILTEQVTFDAGFADEVFAETHGHPFLTVNLMRHYFSWLIEGRRVVTNLHFKASDFLDFAKRELRPASLRRSTHYDFFRHFISHALSDAAARRSRWLHVVVALIQRLTRESPDTFTVSRSDFVRIARPALARLNWDEDYILNTGSQANFLSARTDAIVPSITLFARLTAISLPRVA